MSFRLYTPLENLHESYILTSFTPSPTVPSVVEVASGSGPSSFRDVHHYDYSYKEVEYTPSITDPEEKIRWMDQLAGRMKSALAISGLKLIRANHGTLNNLDTTNQKRAEDLLADLAKYIIEKENGDIQALLEEQLEDMYQLGQCAQGRTTRLWQLIQLIS